MKKGLILLLLIGLIIHTALGQIVCGYEQTNTLESKTTSHIENGGVFTPKGDLRVLIIFITYGGIYDTLDLPGWNNGAYPDWATSSTEKAFYNDFAEFPQEIYSDKNRKSVSNFYYQMSGGRFRLVADYYPQVITVDPTTVSSRGEFHKKVLDQIPNTFDWSPYDNRENKPNYSFDNSSSPADHIADYVVFCHRFSREWNPILPPGWLKSIYYDGVSSTGINQTYSGNNMGNYGVREGFSHTSGTINPIDIFPHEVGHSLYDAPHYAGGNNVAGNYFYEPIAGWGMMHLTQSYTCATGWERYILDWIPQIKASGINSDISSPSDLSATNGIFTLRDFITTGDAIRIRIPTESGKYQYLWLENHQCQSTFDGNFNGTTFCDSPITEYKRGLIAYVESYSHVKDEGYVNLFNNGNGIRWLSEGGDYDYSFSLMPIYPGALCNPYDSNATFQLFKGDKNPIGGQNNNEAIRHDFDNNGFIGYNSDNNSTNHENEQTEAVQVDNELPTAKYFTGTGLQFKSGDKVGIARNPCVKNIPTYNKSLKKMGDYYLNGISFEVLCHNSDGSMVVKIQIDDVKIDKNVRWAASSIVLTDITSNNLPDVDILSSVTVDIDKSGTPNRHKNPANENQTSSNIDDFINPTTFTCRNGSFFKQESASTVNVKNQSTLVLESGSLYEIENGAVLNINATGTLHVKSGATLRVKKTGHVEINSGAYICIEDGANIELVNELSAINLHHGYQLGLNPEIFSGQSNCTATPLVNFPLAIGSEGHFQEFGSNRFIQDTTYYGNAYETGNAIRAGRDVTTQKPYGDVILENGSHVIMDAENDVLLKSGVSVKQGAILEVR